MKKYRIYFEDEVAVAHKLKLPYESKCKRLHGHNYRVQVWIESNYLNKNCMIVDFVDIKEMIRLLDHRDLNELFEQPTVEVIAEWLAEGIKKILKVEADVKVRVWEDKRSYAEVRV